LALLQRQQQRLQLQLLGLQGRCLACNKQVRVVLAGARAVKLAEFIVSCGVAAAKVVKLGRMEALSGSVAASWGATQLKAQLLERC
jgi:hypothetical protein